MDRQRRKQRRTCRHSARACDLCPCLPLPLVPDGNSHMGAVMLREADVGEPRNMLVLGGARSGKSRYAQQCAETFAGELDRKSVVSGKSVSVRVDLGGRRIIKNKNTN